MGLRLLVVEGNVRENRDALVTLFGCTPGESYGRVLRGLAPDAVCDRCCPTDADAALPDAAGLEGYDGAVVTGSALNIYDDSPPVRRQIELARAVFAAGIPFFGSCWGLQLATVAAGGHVVRNPLGREVGIARNIVATALGRTHPMLAGRNDAFDAPCSHFDVISDPPEDTLVLARNRMASIQAAEIRFGAGTFWGVQYHPEFSLRELAAVLTRSSPDLVRQGFFATPEEAGVYCADMRSLDAEPTRRDIAWRLGIQSDVIDPVMRTTEIRNWLQHQVRPATARRGRA